MISGYSVDGEKTPVYWKSSHYVALHANVSALHKCQQLLNNSELSLLRINHVRCLPNCMFSFSSLELAEMGGSQVSMVFYTNMVYLWMMVYPHDFESLHLFPEINVWVTLLNPSDSCPPLHDQVPESVGGLKPWQDHLVVSGNRGTPKSSISKYGHYEPSIIRIPCFRKSSIWSCGDVVHLCCVTLEISARETDPGTPWSLDTTLAEATKNSL